MLVFYKHWHDAIEDIESGTQQAVVLFEKVSGKSTTTSDNLQERGRIQARKLKLPNRGRNLSNTTLLYEERKLVRFFFLMVTVLFE